MSYKRVISKCKKLGLGFKVVQNPSFKYEIVDRRSKLKWLCKSFDECYEAIFQAQTIADAKATSSS